MDDNPQRPIINVISHPIINVILGVDGMLTVCLVTDTSGKDKTMEVSVCEHCWSI